MDHFRAVCLELALSLLLSMGVVGSTEPPAPSPIDGQDLGAFRISVNVDLVVLHATVRDRKGRFASELRAEDFVVYEEGVRQTIRLFRHEDIPVTVGLVVDHSGSMRRKLADVIAAARALAHASNPEDEMFVVNFNESVSLGLPAAVRFTNHLDELEAAILKMPADGMTALYDAVSMGLERLQAGNREKKVLIVISDGGDNASKRELVEVLKMVGQSSALVYTVGIFDEEDPDRNPGVLKRLAHATGGEAYLPADSATLPAVCERIARDIRHQYTIGYVSANPAQPGAYRAIRVVAATAGLGKLSVRSRDGYVAGREPEPVNNKGRK